MSLLLITLPPGPPGSYEYATSNDGQTLASHGTAAIGLLPPAGRGVEVVAMASASQVSWHRVTLPRGVGPGSPRLRPTLIGMLEDRQSSSPRDELEEITGIRAGHSLPPEDSTMVSM